MTYSTDSSASPRCNHYLLDVLPGGAVMGIGFLLARPALRAVDVLRVKRSRPARCGSVHTVAAAGVTEAHMVPAAVQLVLEKQRDL